MLNLLLGAPKVHNQTIKEKDVTNTSVVHDLHYTPRLLKARYNQGRGYAGTKNNFALPHFQMYEFSGSVMPTLYQTDHLTKYRQIKRNLQIQTETDHRLDPHLVFQDRKKGFIGDYGYNIPDLPERMDFGNSKLGKYRNGGVYDKISRSPARTASDPKRHVYGLGRTMYF